MWPLLHRSVNHVGDHLGVERVTTPQPHEVLHVARRAGQRARHDAVRAQAEPGRRGEHVDDCFEISFSAAKLNDCTLMKFGPFGLLRLNELQVCGRMPLKQ